MKLKWVWALANFYMTLWYLCINAHYGKIYIPKYMHACVCAIFAFLLMLQFYIEDSKTSQTWSSAARLCDKSTIHWNANKEISEQRVGINLLVIVISSISWACMRLHLFMFLLVHQCPFHFPWYDLNKTYSKPIPFFLSQSPSGMCRSGPEYKIGWTKW